MRKRKRKKKKNKTLRADRDVLCISSLSLSSLVRASSWEERKTEGLSMLVLPIARSTLLLWHLDFFLFYVYEWFAFIHVCAPGVCMVPPEIRKGCWSDPLVLKLQMFLDPTCM